MTEWQKQTGRLIGCCVLVILAAVFLHSCLPLAMAHVHGATDAQNAWLAEQGSAVGVCCSGSDALTVEDPDWTEVTEDHFTDVKGKIVQCAWASSQKNMAHRASNDDPIRYCAKIAHTWYAIPDSAVVKAKNNPIGAALLWPIMAGKDYGKPDQPDIKNEEGDPEVTYIRCFLPGVVS